MAAITHGAGGAGAPNPPTPFLLRLYPATWRARYGDEFVELLEARPPSLRDRVDIVVGAVDARINPQVVHELPPRIASGRDRLLALAAAAVGALLTAWAAIIVIIEPRWGMGSSLDDGLVAAAYGAGMIGGLLAPVVLLSLAARYRDELGPTGATGALVSVGAFLFMVAGAGTMSLLLLPLGALLLGPGLARIVPWSVALLLIGATLLMSLAMLGFAVTQGQQVLWLALALGYGPSWVLIGICLRRGPRARPSAGPVAFA